MTVPATAPSGAPRSEFIPYVYGATLGRPSRGRPERVLANPDLPETIVRLIDREPVTAPGAKGPTATRGCGTPAGAKRHYRRGEKPCPECLAANAGGAHAQTTTREQEETVGNGRTDGREGRVTARNAIPGGMSRNGLPVGGGYVYRGNDKDELTGHLGRVRLEREAQQAIAALAPADKARLAELEGQLAAQGVVAPEKTAPRTPRPASAKTERQPAREEQPAATAAAAEAKPASAPGPQPVRVAEPLPEPVSEPAPVAQAAPAAPIRRHRKCGYPLGSIGHKITCGDGS